MASKEDISLNDETEKEETPKADIARLGKPVVKRIQIDSVHRTGTVILETAESPAKRTKLEAGIDLPGPSSAIRTKLKDTKTFFVSCKSPIRDDDEYDDDDDDLSDTEHLKFLAEKQRQLDELRPYACEIYEDEERYFDTSGFFPSPQKVKKKENEDSVTLSPTNNYKISEKEKEVIQEDKKEMVQEDEKEVVQEGKKKNEDNCGKEEKITNEEEQREEEENLKEEENEEGQISNKEKIEEKNNNEKEEKESLASTYDSSEESPIIADNLSTWTQFLQEYVNSSEMLSNNNETEQSAASESEGDKDSDSEKETTSSDQSDQYEKNGVEEDNEETGEEPEVAESSDESDEESSETSNSEESDESSTQMEIEEMESEDSDEEEEETDSDEDSANEASDYSETSDEEEYNQEIKKIKEIEAGGDTLKTRINIEKNILSQHPAKQNDLKGKLLIASFMRVKQVIMKIIKEFNEILITNEDPTEAEQNIMDIEMDEECREALLCQYIVYRNESLFYLADMLEKVFSPSAIIDSCFIFPRYENIPQIIQSQYVGFEKVFGVKQVAKFVKYLRRDNIGQFLDVFVVSNEFLNYGSTEMIPRWSDIDDGMVCITNIGACSKVPFVLTHADQEFRNLDNEKGVVFVLEHILSHIRSYFSHLNEKKLKEKIKEIRKIAQDAIMHSLEMEEDDATIFEQDEDKILRIFNSNSYALLTMFIIYVSNWASQKKFALRKEATLLIASLQELNVRYKIKDPKKAISKIFFNPDLKNFGWKTATYEADNNSIISSPSDASSSS